MIWYVQYSTAQLSKSIDTIFKFWNPVRSLQIEMVDCTELAYLRTYTQPTTVDKLFRTVKMAATVRSVCLFATAISFSLLAAGSVPHGSTIMRIVNHAGSPVELFWVNVFEKGRPIVKQTTKAIRNNSETIVSQSYGP